MVSITPTFAQEQWQAPTAKVDFADLDLASTHGAELLYTRLRYAAAEVCGPQADTRLIQQTITWRRCFREAIRNAVVQVDQPSLTAIYLQHTGGRSGETKLAQTMR
jgi:UrcA family protein